MYWYDYPSGWNKENVKDEMTKLLIGSNSTVRNSIEFLIGNESNRINGFINIRYLLPDIDGICEKEVSQTYSGSDPNTYQTIEEALWQSCT